MILEISVNGSAINSLQMGFGGRAKMLGLPMSPVPGTYEIRGQSIVITDVSEREDIVASQKVDAQKAAESDYLFGMKDKYSLADIATITALQADLPEVFEEMRVYLLEAYKKLNAATARIDNVETSAQLSALQK